jgi:CheY-like chemotaxis protein
MTKHQHCLLQAFQVNLIITDYCMPGMTGYDLLKAIKVMHLIHFNMHNLIHVVDSAQYQQAS